MKGAQHRVKCRNKKIVLAVVIALVFFLSGCSGKKPDADASSGKMTESTEQVSEGKAQNTENTEGTGQITESTEPFTEGAEDSSEESTVNRNLMLATLNIKHGAEGLDAVAEAIREVSPDIIGLQEVDVNCERSGYADEPAELARLLEYPYHAFSKAINLGNGEYGTAILSRFPIESFEVTLLPSGDDEQRTVGHAVMDVDGRKLDVFVTHLTYGSPWTRIEQMELIAEAFDACEYYVLLGDLNSFDLEDIYYLDAAYYVNRPDRMYITFPRYELAIDNIIVSEGFTELSSDISDADCSDHRLLYAEFVFGESGEDE